jgi:hypothetical protein
MKQKNIFYGDTVWKETVSIRLCDQIDQIEDVKRKIKSPLEGMSLT